MSDFIFDCQVLMLFLSLFMLFFDQSYLTSGPNLSAIFHHTNRLFVGFQHKGSFACCSSQSNIAISLSLFAFELNLLELLSLLSCVNTFLCPPIFFENEFFLL